MTDATPKMMLQAYREAGVSAGEFGIAQVREFKAMPVKDQCELLFHMLFHNNAMIQHLHGKIDGREAETKGMEEIWGHRQ